MLVDAYIVWSECYIKWFPRKNFKNNCNIKSNNFNIFYNQMKHLELFNLSSYSWLVFLYSFLVCNPDLYSFYLFMTFERWYTTVAFINLVSHALFITASLSDILSISFSSYLSQLYLSRLGFLLTDIVFHYCIFCHYLTETVFCH